MESALPQETASAALLSGSGSEVPPFARQTVELTKQAYIQLKWAASYWKAQYDRAAAREAALKQEVAAHQAQIRDLTQRLYDKKSEKKRGTGRCMVIQVVTERRGLAANTPPPVARDERPHRSSGGAARGHGRRLDPCDLSIRATDKPPPPGHD